MANISLTKTWVDGEELTASDLNANFADVTDVVNGSIDATNLADGAVSSDKIANDAVTAAKMANGMVKHRQGGTSGDGAWNTVGTNNTDTSAKAVKIQVGTVQVNNTATVTFPEAFTQAPVVFVNVISANNGFWAQLNSAATTTSVSISCWSATGTLVNKPVQWIAIGQ